MEATTQFPEGFLLGAATSSYQIEGARMDDGKGPSIWDTFCDTPGAILNGDKADVACDHYHRWREDVALMRSLGLKAYRFSVSWPRVLPAGRGAVNQAGLDFYSRLVDALLEAGIEPNVTLYHWDLPQALQDQGGWQNRDIAGWFADYTAVMARSLGDRVRFWASHNEPWCTAHFGHESGTFAPGFKLAPKQVHQVIHHILLSHGRCVDALRAHASRPVQAGIVWNLSAAWPDSAAPLDVRAAWRAWCDGNDWWVLPVLEGRYPEDGWARRGESVPEVLPGDLAQIGRGVDWLGINYYFPSRFAHDATDKSLGVRGKPKPEGAEASDWGWEVEPDCLYTMLLEFTRRYGRRPLLVSENGFCAFGEGPGADGRVADDRRIAYLARHLQACRAAMDRGVDLRGYFAWSLMDNFEWATGYKPQFGLVHVDRGTQRRTPKDSALWFSGVAKTGGFGRPPRAFVDPYESMK